MKTITFDETKWKLVPIEPTRDMYDDFMAEAPFGKEYFGDIDFTQAYKAMLEAAGADKGKDDE